MPSEPVISSKGYFSEHDLFALLPSTLLPPPLSSSSSSSSLSSSSSHYSPNGRIDSFRDLTNLSQYLWPAEKPHVKRRVLLLVALFGAIKIIPVSVRFLFKHEVDAIVTSPDESSLYLTVALLTVTLLGSGAVRAGGSLPGKLLNPVFASVTRKVIVDVAVSTFRHIHQLPLPLPSSRETGALDRLIDRCKNEIDFILRSMVLNVLQTMLEVKVVCAILAAFAASTVLVYTAFTFAKTQWRTRFRRKSNDADTAATSKEVD